MTNLSNIQRDLPKFERISERLKFVDSKILMLAKLIFSSITDISSANFNTSLALLLETTTIPEESPNIIEIHERKLKELKCIPSNI